MQYCRYIELRRLRLMSRGEQPWANWLQFDFFVSANLRYIQSASTQGTYAPNGFVFSRRGAATTIVRSARHWATRNIRANWLRFVFRSAVAASDIHPAIPNPLCPRRHHAATNGSHGIAPKMDF